MINGDVDRQNCGRSFSVLCSGCPLPERGFATSKAGGPCIGAGTAVRCVGRKFNLFGLPFRTVALVCWMETVPGLWDGPGRGSMAASPHPGLAAVHLFYRLYDRLAADSHFVSAVKELSSSDALLLLWAGFRSRKEIVSSDWEGGWVVGWCVLCERGCGSSPSPRGHVGMYIFAYG